MDCLAVTGSNPAPLALIAGGMIALAVVLLVAVRRARSTRTAGDTPGSGTSARRTGVALTMMAVLTVTAAGGMSLLGTSTAHAATTGCTPRSAVSGVAATDASQDETTDETVVTVSDETATDQNATDENGTDVVPADEGTAEETTPEDPEETAPEDTTPDGTTPDEDAPEETTPDEDAPEETTPDEDAPEETTPDKTTPEETVPEDGTDVTPVADTFALSFLTYAQPALTTSVTSELRPLAVTRVSGTDDGSAITLVVPDQADGYWTATALLNADGSTATDVTMTRESGATVFTIATQPDDSRTFLVELTYDTTSWDPGSWVVGSSSGETLRPSSSLTVTLRDHAAGTDGSVTQYIAEYRLAHGGPPIDEDD